MKRIVLTGMLACTLLLAACGGGDDSGGSAGDAVIQQMQQLSRGQMGRQWDDLHPAQQALIPRDHFVQCGGIEVNIDGTKVIETYEEEVLIPGTDQRVQSTAVTVEMTFSSGEAKRTQTQTFHEILVDDEWRWIVADPAAYADGQCP